MRALPRDLPLTPPLRGWRACGFGRQHAAALVVGLLIAPAARSAAEVDAWLVAGQQGLVRFVIVPVALAADQPAYERQIGSLCDPERTCFLNFYTNSTGAPVAVPLPDAIASEATATFRRSMKNGAERFMWSCRLKLVVKDCF
ncbi:hypothetical protein [Ideonella sp. A 288]|uniref:hypothetical protein n=1 Tax=Ideonella sp. A 288 TaxID=1962181 RepID=UPI0018FED739|nr:hypothetical protein [Ideonella sp. A 288]